MSLSILDSFSLELVLNSLKANTLARLWIAASPSLRAKMRRIVRNFDLCLDFCHPASLNHLLATLATISDSMASLRVYEHHQYKKVFIPSSTDWTLLPNTLSTLQLPNCILFDASAIKLLPTLHTLEVRCVKTEIDLLELPHTLTKLSIESTTTELGTLLSRLPPNLRFFHSSSSMRATAVLNPLATPLLEYFHLNVLRCDVAADCPWKFFPQSLTYLSVKFYDDIQGCLVNAPSSLSLRFPRLVEFRAMIPLWNLYDGLLDMPASLEVLYVMQHMNLVRGVATQRSRKQVKEFFQSPGMLQKASQLRSVQSVSDTILLEYYTGLEALEFDDIRDDKIPQITRFTRLQTLSVPTFLSADELKMLPKTITSLGMLAELSSAEFLSAATSIDHSAWPPLLDALTITVNYDQHEYRRIGTLHLEILPSTLTSLTFLLQPRLSTIGNILPIFNRSRFRYIKGDLLHMNRLETLQIGNATTHRAVIDNFAYSPLFTSPMQLPQSLTSLASDHHSGFSVNVIADGWDATTGLHRFDKLKTLLFGRDYPKPLTSPEKPNSALPSSHHASKPQDAAPAPHKYAITTLFSVGASHEHSYGLDTQLFKLLPRNLEHLRMSCAASSQPWSDEIIKSLPRKLLVLELLEIREIRFESETTSCLQHLPSNLIALSFKSDTFPSSGDATSLFPADFWTYLPLSIPHLDINPVIKDAQTRRYIEHWQTKLGIPPTNDFF